MEKIKEILLADDYTLLNVVRELNAFNGSFSEFNYYHQIGDYYVLMSTNETHKIKYIINLCKEKIDEIIIAMLENYNHIDVCNSELEDYISSREV